MADLLSGLSRLADLGFGLTAGESARSGALAAALARSLGLPEDDVRAAFYTALLQHIGCTGYAHEVARVFGDEFSLNAAAARVDDTDPRDLFATFLPVLTAGRPPLRRARLAVAALGQGQRFARAYTTATCEVGRDVARRLSLPEDVQRGVYHVYEVWRGGGFPAGLAGEDIPLAARVARLSGIAVLFDTLSGPQAATAAIRRRGGGMLDPGMTEHFGRRGEALLAGLAAGEPAALVLEAEPQPALAVPETRLVDVAAVFGDVVDLKTPHLHGHSRGVAELARAAAARLGLPAAVTRDVEIAASLHDLGRAGVPDRVWEKPGRLSEFEAEQARLHAYHSERIVGACRDLAPVARLVGMHHERLDGTGYHRGCRGAEIPMPARVLAAADAYQGRTQRRPHRPALRPEQAAEQLLAETRRGLLDPDAADAVLAAAGHRVPRPRRRLPAGLTEREVEVLGLLAHGCSNAEIARRLVISRRTAEHHVAHAYTKIGVSSRAAAALFAMEHDLLPAADG